MKTPLTTIQQTLTPEASSILTHSISEASRRGHGQTTPLHVAATLLASPTSPLRRACTQSHPNSSHPLQCRALELCFSVALDRLPPSASAPAEPPISNALMAALKRAQAHQRRGCPEQQQQPLLAVKVELEHVLVAILDDPSVSRVMREAGFSSTAVKAVVENSIAPVSLPAGNIARSVYVSPRMQGPPLSGSDEVKRVFDVLVRAKRRNAVLVGDSEPGEVVREVLRRIESGEGPVMLKNVKVVSFAKELGGGNRSEIRERIKELGGVVEGLLCGGGVMVDLGDLKWIVESSIGTGIGVEVGRGVVDEMNEMLKRFRDVGLVWIVGTASCATYLRCQVYFPAMENDWDIQAVPIAPKASIGSKFSKIGGNGILSSSVETLSPMKGLMTSSTIVAPQRRQLEAADSSEKKPSLCPSCMESYERELAKLVAKEFEKSSQHPEAEKKLPQWLQLAKLSKGHDTGSCIDKLQSKEQELTRKRSTEELMERWQYTCSRQHLKFTPIFPAPSLSKQLSMSSSGTSVEAKLRLNPNLSVHQLKSNPHFVPLDLLSGQKSSRPPSPVKTDLVLANSKLTSFALDKPRLKNKDHRECMQDRLSNYQSAKLAGISDVDSYKSLVKGLIDQVAWQQEAAVALASAVIHSRSRNSRSHTGRLRGDTWILFTGPDRVGKRKMADVLSELLFGTGPATISFSSCTSGSDGESSRGTRGRTTINKVVEAVRCNPLSVVVLEDIDQADGLVLESIKQAMDKGYLSDSYCRDVSLGNVIFILTSSWVPQEMKRSYDSLMQSEEKLLNSAYRGWQLELSTVDKLGKRQADWHTDYEQSKKQRKESGSGLGISLDLNLALGVDDESADGSRNSSDLTVEYENEKFGLKCSASSAASDLIGMVENSILFKPVDFSSIRQNILDSISTKFTTITGCKHSVRVEDDALDRIVAGLWLSGSIFNDWAERVLIPSLKRLTNYLRTDDDFPAIRLSIVKGDQPLSNREDWLPTTVTVSVDGI